MASQIWLYVLIATIIGYYVYVGYPNAYYSQQYYGASARRTQTTPGVNISKYYMLESRKSYEEVECPCKLVMSSGQTTSSLERPVESDEYERFVKPDNSVNIYEKQPTGVESHTTCVKEQLKIAFCLNVGHLLIGYSIGWSAPVIPKLQNLEESPVGRVITDVEASWVASIFLLTNLIVVNIAGFVANVIGRKPYLIFSSAMMFCGYILLIAASDISMILVGRIFVGLGIGPISVMNMIYIGEIAPPNIRGMMAATTGVVHVLGSLLVYSVGPFVSYVTVSYVALVIGAVYTGCGFCIPESPVFYAMKGNIEAAKTTLRKLGRSNEIETLETEFKLMFNGLEGHRAIIRNWRELFTEKINRKSLRITGVIFILQEGCGALTVIFFATNIFKSANSSIAPHIGTIILGVVELIGVLCTPFLIERSGRKTLLFISSSVCGLSLATLGLYFYVDFVKQGAISRSFGWAPLMLLVIFILGYNCGFSVVPNTLLGEMFTPTVRSTGSSFSFTLGILSCFVTNIAYGYMLSMGNYVIFWSLACVNIIAFVFTAICVPETKGKSLTEIQNMLAT